MKLMRVTAPEDVIKIINDNFTALAAESVPLDKSGGRCLAENIYAPEDVPGFDRSTVDGYAVLARDTFGSGEGIPAMLECIGEVLMGKKAPQIKEGQCCLVHTGGMLPEGSDAVVMIEDTESAGTLIQIFRQVAPAENVIHKGEDLKEGVLALSAGHRLRAPEIGMLASLGVSDIAVHRRPKIGFYSSGDELVDYHTGSLAPGQIRDSNAPALLYLASQMDADIEYGGILPDIFETFLEKSKSMLEKVDFLVFSGGSSVGSRDFTAKTMNELGKPGLLVEGIAIQPGKPTLLASCNGKPVLGLPGHPVSALNIFAIFGEKIINRLTGKAERTFHPTVSATLSRNISSRSGRTEYVRVKLQADKDIINAVPVFGRSGMMRTLAEADGLLVIPAESEGLRAGTKVKITLWD
ncbi:MAG: gephyrin-like molybdotransferase Glp [Dethiobacteria bacterium]